jgi:hypothetical protein
VEGSHYYDPGCRYLSNGDPGYPPEEDLSIDHVSTVEVEMWENKNEGRYWCFIVEGKDAQVLYDAHDLDSQMQDDFYANMEPLD